MYKKILTIFALAASLLACNKVENEVVAPENGAMTLTITATLGDPATRLSYSEATDGSYKARFNNEDVVWAYFAKADNSVAGPVTKLAIDPKSISFDGKTACFRQPAVSIPEGSTKIIAYLANTANTTNFDGGDDIVSDISSQANLTAALNNQVIYGAVDFKDLTSTDPDALAASIPFSYKTSLLKFSLALPEGTEVDPKAAVSVTLANGKIHNKLHISGGVLGAKSEEGDLKLGATVANGMVSAAAAVWAADDLNSKIFVNIGEDTFIADFKPAASIVAGKVYTVERTLAVSAKPVTMWANDDAASVDFKYSGGEDLTNDWLSCKAGKISWTANTTGAPRTAKLTFKNGSSFEMWQADPKDLVATFAGAYTLTGDVRTPTKGGAATQATTDNQDGVKYGTLGGVTKGSWYDQAWIADGKGDSIDITLEAAEGEHVMCAKGIYENLVMPVDLLIDYEKQTFGMNFVIENKAYLITSGMYKDLGQYAAFATELMEGSNWCLGFGNGGAFNYYGSVDLSTGNIVVKFAKGQKCTAFNTYNVVGILVNRYASESTAGTALIRSQKSAYAFKNLKLSGAAYARVIQNDFTITKK